MITLGINIVKNGHVTTKPFWSNVVKTKNFPSVQPLLNSEIIKLPPI